MCLSSALLLVFTKCARVYKLLEGTGKDDASTTVDFVERDICALPKQPLPLPLTKAEFQ